MITVIDYGAGNIGSIVNMFKRLGAATITTSDPVCIKEASKLVLPGVGSFDVGISKLKESGLVEILNQKVIEEKIPILGICLGVQLMTKGSEEGNLPGLGWFNAETIKFKFDDLQTKLKIPHMGWADTIVKKASPLFSANEEEHRYYYVHSYHLSANNENDILVKAHYGYEFAAGLEKENIMGVQFHPEKSHKFGMRLFKNFIDNI
ncbi:MAG TPA: imidazole glycerol phosphate synthase subunit HisH [Chitinophagaceae bacterium]|nr:imidazole glycerol phosphate synthase subunit HisH [Chitinophagaceae bacterium]